MNLKAKIFYLTGSRGGILKTAVATSRGQNVIAVMQIYGVCYFFFFIFRLLLFWSQTHSVPGHLVLHNWSRRTNSPGSFSPRDNWSPWTNGPQTFGLHRQMVPKKIGPQGLLVPKIYQ